MKVNDLISIAREAGDELAKNFGKRELTEVVGIGDSAASLISPEMYAELVMPLERKLIAAIHEAGAAAKLHVCGNITNIVQHIAQTGTDIIDVDWMVPLVKARSLAGPDVTLCGNFNPAGVLFEGTPQEVAEAACECLAAMPNRFILMPGCEVPPGTPEQNIRAFCRAASKDELWPQRGTKNT